MPKRRDINKVKAVAKTYLNNGFNLPEALKDNNNGKELSGNGYNSQASDWRKDNGFKAIIEQELAKFPKGVINDVFCISELFDIIKGNTSKPSDKVNAIATLARILKLGNEQGNTTNITFDISKLPPLPVKSIIDIQSIASSTTKDIHT